MPPHLANKSIDIPYQHTLVAKRPHFSTLEKIRYFPHLKGKKVRMVAFISQDAMCCVSTEGKPTQHCKFRLAHVSPIFFLAQMVFHSNFFKAMKY